MGEEGDGRVAGVDRDWLGRVLDTVRELGGLTDLAPTLDAVVRGVCDVGGFGSAAINVTDADGSVVVRAVCGGAESLLGEQASLDTWLDLLDHASRWRDLRYYRHDHDQSRVAQLATWDPPRHEAADGAVADGPTDPWHPEDLLLAPMWAPDGSLIGVVSVDEPAGRRFPGPEQLTILGLLAAQAGRAISAAAREASSDDRASLFGAAFECAATGMAIVGSDLEVVALNDAGRALLGVAAAGDLVGEPFAGLVDGRDAEEVEGACRDALRSSHLRPTVECRLPSGPGESRWVRARVARVDSTLHRARLVLNLEDVTDSRRAMAELQHQANHDMLTGLPNRRLAYDLLDQQLASVPADRAVVVLACDLDGFKAVNDRLGHATGDELLVQVSRRLTNALSDGDVLARMGGDEFVVVSTVHRDRDGVGEQLAQRCIDRIRAPFALTAATCSVTLSVGVATSDHASDLDAAGLIDQADQALYGAKAAGRDRWAAHPASPARAGRPAAPDAGAQPRRARYLA
ncbi:GGDEF domain-containing protein [Aquihabitans sp. G128]|uniref:sensor domain-containing diguanylate cyclase n=1 Tax=Aquihabitans sp. G128 TaxID=2849779 RepID=UPI001C24B7F0|nr:GGDEF domain-containing protein [Aquihabitans sp. G128]QXC60899.1 GGDEF domain-containing protein [Aquihabitans sp. G128]